MEREIQDSQYQNIPSYYSNSFTSGLFGNSSVNPLYKNPVVMSTRPQFVPVPSYMLPVYDITSPNILQNNAFRPQFNKDHSVTSTFAQNCSTNEVSSTNLPTKIAHIGVFWDIENCGVPRGKSALSVVQKIRERFFQPNYIETEFVTVCDIRKESPQIIQELNDAQVTVIHVAGISKNAADDKLRQAMRRYADAYSTVGRGADYAKTHGTPAILLITGDINFASDLSDLRYRKRIHVILLHNRHAPAALLICAHEHHEFHSGLEGIPGRTQNEIQEKSGTQAQPITVPQEQPDSPEDHYDIVVSDLPVGTSRTKIEDRLRRLSYNCGGKVVRINGQFATLRFKSQQAAFRAAKRIHGEVVCGANVHTTAPFCSKELILPPQPCHFFAPPKPTPPASNLLSGQLSKPTQSLFRQPATQSTQSLTFIPQQMQSNPSHLEPRNELSSSGDEWNMWTSPTIAEDLPRPTATVQPNLPIRVKPKISPRKGKVKIKIEQGLKVSDSGVSSSSKSDQAESEGIEKGTSNEEVKGEQRSVNGPELRSKSDSNGNTSKGKEVMSAIHNVTASEDTTVIDNKSKAIPSLASKQDRLKPDATLDNVLPPLLAGILDNIFSVSEETMVPNEAKLGLMHIVTDFEEFATRTNTLFGATPSGVLEFAEFCKKYKEVYGWAEVSEKYGVPVEHLISAIPGIELQYQNEIRNVVMKSIDTDEVTKKESGQRYDFTFFQLKLEMVNLLKSIPYSTMELSQIERAYEKQYGKKILPHDFNGSLFDFLDTRLRSSVHFMGDPSTTLYITLQHEVQMKRFAVDILRVLKSRRMQMLPLEDFDEAYSSVIGVEFEATLYGMCSLRDLVKELTLHTTTTRLQVQRNGQTCLSLT